MLSFLGLLVVSASHCVMQLSRRELSSLRASLPTDLLKSTFIYSWKAYVFELSLCMLDRLWNIIPLYGRHILSKTSKQSKVYKDDLLEDFLGLRTFHMHRDVNN